MGKLKVIKTGPLTTIQDFGRFGFRRYGIPQSGAMDRDWMIAANRLAGNPGDYPVIEFAMMGMTLEVQEETILSVVGASMKIHQKTTTISRFKLQKGNVVEVSKPTHVYAYLAIGGSLEAQKDFESYSTYTRAGFGGMEGRALQKGDVLITDDNGMGESDSALITPGPESELTEIRIMKGPEWNVLKELPDSKTFEIDCSSDRMGIRLTGTRLEAIFQEIASSAVVPGTIQLCPDGSPIVLMNDCQTTGGYPRIGKVRGEDMRKLAQLTPGKQLKFIT